MTLLDTAGTADLAHVRDVYGDGTIQVDLGNGRLVGPCMCADSLTPAVGDVVVVQRLTGGTWIAVCRPRTSNPAPPVMLRHSFPYQVIAAPTGGGASGTLVLPAVSMSSWRSGTGWTDGTALQGAYGSATYGYWSGAVYYDLAPIRGVPGTRCTSCTLHIARCAPYISGSGPSSQTVFHVALHANETRPAESPLFVTDPISTVPLTWNAEADIDLGTTWGQALLDLRAKGVGLLYGGFTDYTRLKTPAELSISGRLTIGWQA